MADKAEARMGNFTSRQHCHSQMNEVSRIAAEAAISGDRRRFCFEAKLLSVTHSALLHGGNERIDCRTQHKHIYGGRCGSHHIMVACRQLATRASSECEPMTVSQVRESLSYSVRTSFICSNEKAVHFMMCCMLGKYEYSMYRWSKYETLIMYSLSNETCSLALFVE